MKAFSNDPKLKEFYVKRMDEHIKLDNLIQGITWAKGKGCFIGCTLEGYNHDRFEKEGIGATWLAHLADRIFEGLSKENAKWFASNFYKKMKVGVDLDLVKKEFLIYVNELNLELVKKLNTNKDFKKQAICAIEDCIFAITCDDPELLKQASAAARGASAAAVAAVGVAARKKRNKEMADHLLLLLSGEV